eukprot:TRINITY_DN59964_c0_g1_i1.p1 TRINITY_DN59964_c0_g1~~TRINITY_DN59964_c0_g1_i1.p1  ORF type:complete len:670 (+),score=158.40 TRINITY_DN59964_c0_g1_i1:84-2012(+)
MPQQATLKERLRYGLQRHGKSPPNLDTIVDGSQAAGLSDEFVIEDMCNRFSIPYKAEDWLPGERCRDWKSVWQKLREALQGRPINAQTIEDALRAAPAVTEALQMQPRDVRDSVQPALGGQQVSPEVMENWVRLRWCYCVIDDDASGFIDNAELGSALGDSQMQRELQCEQGNARELFQRLDRTRSGAVLWDDFYCGMKDTEGPQPPPRPVSPGTAAVVAPAPDAVQPQTQPPVLHQPPREPSPHHGGGYQGGGAGVAPRPGGGAPDGRGRGAKTPPRQEIRPPEQPPQPPPADLARVWVANRQKAGAGAKIDVYNLDGATVACQVPDGHEVRVFRRDAYWLCVNWAGREAHGFINRAKVVERRPEESAPAAQAPAVPAPGGELMCGGRYRKDKLIGQGAFGKVYLCTRVSDQIQLVVKVPVLGADVTVDEVRQEADIMRRLKHKNIIRLIDTHPVEGQHGMLAIVSEFADGGDLYKLLSKSTQGLDQVRVLKFSAQLLDALNYLHTSTPVFLHRDLKPANVLLTSGEHIKLADLGLARMVRQHEQAMTYCGTPNYMAPEIHDGLPYLAPADVFALGCMIYEMATGRLRFRSVKAICDMQAALPKCPPYCAWLVDGCVQHKPEHRATAGQLLERPELRALRR